MKKLILILTLLTAGLFAQESNIELLYRGSTFEEAGGNLYTSLNAGLYESGGMALKISPPAPFTLTQTGAVLQAFLDGTITVLIDPTAGIKVTTHSITTDSTLAAALCYGGVFYVPEAQTITLPAIAEGMSITFITIGANAVSIDANDNDDIWLDGTQIGDGNKATNTSTTGDIIVFTYYSAVGWYAASNSWTDGGA